MFSSRLPAFPAPALFTVLPERQVNKPDTNASTPGTKLFMHAKQKFSGKSVSKYPGLELPSDLKVPLLPGQHSEESTGYNKSKKTYTPPFKEAKVTPPMEVIVIPDGSIMGMRRNNLSASINKSKLEQKVAYYFDIAPDNVFLLLLIKAPPGSSSKPAHKVFFLTLSIEDSDRLEKELKIYNEKILKEQSVTGFDFALLSLPQDPIQKGLTQNDLPNQNPVDALTIITNFINKTFPMESRNPNSCIRTLDKTLGVRKIAFCPTTGELCQLDSNDKSYVKVLNGIS
ncbi:MAG: hypothetical protein AAGI66_08610 [Cyanobacteria bacterium P01_H01_bin.74]